MAASPRREIRRAAGISVADLAGSPPGVTLGPSRWMPVEQAVIDGFGDLTGDRQWIHVDVAKAAQGPFGSTVAHGFLLLSLMPVLFGELVDLSAAPMVVNYGLDRVRFTAPVPASGAVRLSATLRGSEPKGEGTLLRFGWEVELQGASRPAFVADFLMVVFT
jgi:acyl dehydratase